MQELKENLEIVAGYASDNAAKAQERYTHYYNLRARDKHFAVGDRVIDLTIISVAHMLVGLDLLL